MTRSDELCVERIDGRLNIRHAWPVDAPRCRAIQAALAQHVVTYDDLGPVTYLGGVDIGFEDAGQTTRAAAVVLDANTLDVVDRVLVRQPTRMPYIPGLLSFREVPAAVEALERLQVEPDLVHVDGHGIAHPRGLGVASHLGLLTGLATIGVAKKRLTGTFDSVPEPPGSNVPLRDKRGGVIGRVYRSRARVKPIFISTGHRVGLDSAVEWTRRALAGYKLPETTRQADKLASRR